nr:eukaryotic translation elongation factor 1 delta b (guanine nucleotide exchange protein) isoform X2 [Doryrhamphus excisus]XP_057929510.1 eukaryotic translation elongation factor 1 delta b (guanine nucleotide exchange protein) isoform X2 [Doryrhamphus excisus]
MSKKTPRCTAADLSAHMTSTQSQVDCSASSVAERRAEANSNHSTSSSPESGSVNGNGKRNGKRRRSKKRSSKTESDAEEKVNSNEATSETTARRLIGLRSECANVWFERGIYEQAESLNQCWLANSSKRTPDLNPEKKAPRPGKKKADHHIEKPVQPTDSSEHSSQIDITSRTRSQAPDGQQTAAVAPAARQSVNGLSPVLAELFRNVWLEKPQYDRAEASFYQNLHGNNSSAPRSSDRPQSLVEEDEEEVKRVVPQAKAEVFHALHPIQEEEEPVEVPEKHERQDPGICYLLHPDSERVWSEKWRFDAAESRFHAGTKAWRPKTTDSTVHPTENNMSTVNFLLQEKIWFDKTRYDEAERRFFESVNSSSRHPAQAVRDAGANSILQDIARARENIQKSLAGNASSSNASDQELVCRIKSLEVENQSLHKVVHDLRAALLKLESRVAVLEKSPVAVASAPSVPYTNGTTAQQKASAPAKEETDDDLDLFGSDDDDNEEAEKLKEQRLKEYAERKAKKPAVIAKSSILLDVKPWDDETDMAKLEECVRSVQADGLLWGVSKLVPVGYGIKKLQISCVVEDDKVGTDLLEEEITKFEDYVQSVDVAAFNKI